MRFTAWLPILLTATTLTTSCVTVLVEPSARERSAELDSIPRTELYYGKAARTKIRKAYQIYAHQPERATVLFLTAARELEPYYRTNDWAYDAYQDALGMGIELTQAHQLWGKTFHCGEHSIKLPNHCVAPNHLSSQIDTLQYSGKFKSPALQPTIQQRGHGVSMVAHSKWTEERKAASPFLPKIGYFFSVTATAQWGEPNTVAFHLKESRDAPHLSANFTIPHALTDEETAELKYQGILNVYRPEKGIKEMELFTYEPVDPQRIPVIFVHGLAASPNLWIKPTHRLLQDPLIREKYQFFAFYYPTGLPLSHSAAGLKHEVRELRNYLTQHGAGDNAKNMVIIGHSMGGLLTSAITRDYRGALEEIYTKDTDELEDDTQGKRAIIELLETPPLDCVTRAIFVATPHRGSKYASNWLGRWTSHLIDIPKNIVNIDPTHYNRDLTRLGKTIFDINEGMDGVQRLSLDNSALRYNLSRPKLPYVTYHSIIGDRGWPGKLENSTDGIVTYQSSHIEGVASELVVPAWHNAQDNRKGQEEMLRILRLHLETE